MNEISEVLKSTREMSGVSINEVSKDLDIPIITIEQIEEGNIGSFKDIFLLKQQIISYAKYLGLDPDDVTNHFIEYMFEITSKIPMDEIEKAAKLKEEEMANDTRISSPYTRLASKAQDKQFVFMIILIGVLVIIAFLWAVKQVTIGNTTTNIISYFNN